MSQFTFCSDEGHQLVGYTENGLKKNPVQKHKEKSSLMQVKKYDINVMCSCNYYYTKIFFPEACEH